MSKVEKKGRKSTQHSLDLYDPSVQQEHDGDLDFVLKIHEGHLHELEISSVANLLSALGQIVGVKQASFKTIKEGSTTIAVTVPQDCKALAMSNVLKETSAKHKQVARIQKELGKYGFHGAEISYGTYKENEVYKPAEILYTVPEPEFQEEFSQEESLDGCLTRLQKGKDKSDHITIILNNGDEVAAECSHKLLKELHPYFDIDKCLRFEGIATYLSTSNSYQLKLKKYSIIKFTVIDDVGIEEWVDNFRAQGTSNWSKFDDPIAEWLKERQD
ncbi:hypothetical protein [Acinetobacter courvalinii]|uniref:hypothetical protein n=1 Tax=Acinetobacter courvalinii TaxID=280147 RepID=UPI0018FF58FF|nr:hypothetical protein [Acinetobacter courvalinii]MBJ8417524.1 hypothetical protein [Acinetobacter courvalinii]